MSKKIVLVYSGGLDTSICVPMMKEEYGYAEVVTVTVDARAEFGSEYCFTSLKANGDYQVYPMSTSIARPVIAEKAVEVANHLGTSAFAHGCTGKGLESLTVEDLRAFHPALDEGSVGALSHVTVMNARTSRGGTAPAAVLAQIKKATSALG